MAASQEKAIDGVVMQAERVKELEYLLELSLRFLRSKYLIPNMSWLTAKNDASSKIECITRSPTPTSQVLHYL